MENAVWPDKVRLYMIERSKAYGKDRNYHYGFYDGYQYATKKTDTYNLREILNDLNYTIEINLQSGIDNVGTTYLKNVYNKLSDEITKIEELYG